MFGNSYICSNCEIVMFYQIVSIRIFHLQIVDEGHELYIAEYAFCGLRDGEQEHLPGGGCASRSRSNGVSAQNEINCQRL